MLKYITIKLLIVNTKNYKQEDKTSAIAKSDLIQN